MQDMDIEQPIPFEMALRAADAAVVEKTTRHLRNIEVAVLRGTWQGRKYDEIAVENGYAPEYIKHDVGPKLWQLLSQSLGERVSKTNLVAVLTQRAVAQEIEAPQPVEPVGVSDRTMLVGLVPIGSRFYVDRPPVEARCYEEILKPGALIRIKAPSQMGKTSLMVRILGHAKQTASGADEASESIFTVPLNLQQADSQIFQNLDEFLRWFCMAITRKLRLSHRIEDYWSPAFGSKGNCTAYFEDCILSAVNAPIILAIDCLDAIFGHPEIADDFFALLRSWYEEAAYGDSGNPLWQQLRLVIVHSTEVYIPLNINQSPFNVGLAIELYEFTPEQVTDLASRYGLQLSQPQLVQLMDLIGGHPYLIQQALYYLAQHHFTLDQLLQTAPTDAGIYRNHLHRHLRSLQEHPELAAAYDQVIKAIAPVEIEQVSAFKLHSMGLVRLQGNQVVPSYGLYRQYFGDRK